MTDPALRRALRVRWTIVLVPATIYLFSYFHRVAPAVVAADLMRAFAITAASLGTLIAIYPYVFAAMAFVAGTLADTVGARRTLTLGGATMGVGAVLFGAAPTFEVAYAARLLMGLGASVILIAWLRLASEWFRPHEFATISGGTQTVGNLGALMASSPLAWLVDAVGWRWTFVMVGAVTIGVALLTVALVRDRPQAIGLPALSAERAAEGRVRLADTLATIPEVLRTRDTWPPVVAAAGAYATLIAFLGLWGVPYLTQVYGLGRAEAANRVALLAVGMGVGAPMVGWVSDRWLGRRRLPLAALTGVYALCWAALALPEAPAIPVGLLAPFFLIMGLGAGALVLVWSCVREVNPPDRMGVIVATANAPMFLGIALLQWAMGVILDGRWAGAVDAGARIYPAPAYRAAFLLCLGVAAAAFVASCLVRETRCRNVWRAATP